MVRAAPIRVQSSVALIVAAGLVAGCGRAKETASSDPFEAPRVTTQPAVATSARATSVPAATATVAKTSGTSFGPGPWNVLLLSIDSLRTDMPWNGYPRPITPRLSELHAKSIAYRSGYATSSFTSKSVAGMISGKYPSEMARTGDFFTKYLGSNRFMCETLKDANVPCVAAHAHAYFGNGTSGFEQGFTTWKLVPAIPFDYNKDPYVTSDKLGPLAIATLTEVAKDARPFFAWFHFMDPHDEYKGHKESPHFGSKPRDLYDEEVFWTDLWVGKVLDFVESQPWATKTMIIVTADHGEAFGEHGLTRHAHELWEVLVHVPWFFSIPGANHRLIDEPRGHVDLVPTILDALGQKPDPSLAGTSLLPELRGESAPPRDVIVDLPEDEYNERRRALVHGTKKLIAFGEDKWFALYDLAADPKEADDLARKDPKLLEEMKGLYKAASKRIEFVPPKNGIPRHDK
ncbi:MAG: sulfatase [Polyangiaceae bacterium]